jgi:hypothetical protein
MYDGNNANLQLPPEQNAFWARLWAQPGAQGNAAAVSAFGAGAPVPRSGPLGPEVSTDDRQARAPGTKSAVGWSR